MFFFFKFKKLWYKIKNGDSLTSMQAGWLSVSTGILEWFENCWVFISFPIFQETVFIKINDFILHKWDIWVKDTFPNIQKRIFALHVTFLDKSDIELGGYFKQILNIFEQFPLLIILSFHPIYKNEIFCYQIITKYDFYIKCSFESSY